MLYKLDFYYAYRHDNAKVTQTLKKRSLQVERYYLIWWC